MSVAVLTLGVPAGSAGSVSRCRALPFSQSVAGQLEGAYRSAARLPAAVHLRIEGQGHYGQCGETQYGFASIQPAYGQRLTGQEKITMQDHSALFVGRAHRSWRDLPLGPICGGGHAYLPTALAEAWGMACA